MRVLLLTALAFAGCATDDFVIFGDSDSCSSSGEAEPQLGDDDAATSAAAVSKSGPAAMSSRPAPTARPATTPLDSKLPATPAQERR
ncbi:hypothetical protein [Nannocystis sp.]|uniref:hypothetical protein n=1 Tax=Nannocystis sp. TaxID=1962667 RepID=UPI0025ECD877|nr:hypothetical protein [Nannocystis sp.]MBK7826374.1 hypothetical protein [Nannocystis sp.]